MDTAETQQIPIQFYGPTPLTFEIGRAGPFDTILKYQGTDDVAYLIHETMRSSLSSKPDFEIHRQSSTPGGDMVGTVRFGKLSTETIMTSTGSKSKGLEQVHLNQPSLAGNFTWKTLKNRASNVKLKWMHNEAQASKSAVVKDEVVVLALIGGHYNEQSPACVVRLYGAIPKGTIEIYASEAQIDKGGSWDVLDELVVTAYANTESVNKELLKRADTYWAENGARWIAYGGPR